RAPKSRPPPRSRRFEHRLRRAELSRAAAASSPAAGSVENARYPRSRVFLLRPRRRPMARGRAFAPAKACSNARFPPNITFGGGVVAAHEPGLRTGRIEDDADR